MTLRNKLVSALLVLAVVFVFVAPIGPVPGFFIGGKATSVPSEWPDTARVNEILLKVPGTPARVVVIWLVQVEGSIYVVGNADSGWVQRIGEQGAVAMRLEGNTYALQANRVRENLPGIVTAYKDKYRPNYPDIVAGFPSLEEAKDGFAVFRLTAPAD
ncbi:MAG: hypothetical protein VW867_04055 [Gammaproteobacteria bacterium]|jgi:hypothetical protein